VRMGMVREVTLAIPESGKWGICVPIQGEGRGWGVKLGGKRARGGIGSAKRLRSSSFNLAPIFTSGKSLSELRHGSSSTLAV